MASAYGQLLRTSFRLTPIWYTIYANVCGRGTAVEARALWAKADYASGGSESTHP